MAHVANQGHQQFTAFERRATILVMLVLADSEIRLRVDDAAVEVTSFDQRHSIRVMVAGTHDTNSNSTVFGEEVAKRDDIPIIGQLFDACICEMGASDFL